MPVIKFVLIKTSKNSNYTKQIPKNLNTRSKCLVLGPSARKNLSVIESKIKILRTISDKFQNLSNSNTCKFIRVSLSGT